MIIKVIIMNFNNIDNYAQMLNDTQTIDIDRLDLTEGELDELFGDIEDSLESDDWNDRFEDIAEGDEVDEEPKEFSAMDWLVEQDLSDDEFEFLMAEF